MKKNFSNYWKVAFFDDCNCSDEFDPVCVEIQTDEGVIIITFPNACFAECEGFTEDQYFECDGCDCPNEYDPVCVEENGKIIIFDNECFAECHGYGEDQWFDCPSDGCEIDDLEVIVGDCNDDGTYSITINFEYENAGNDYFDVFIRENEHIGSFTLAELPVTIENFEISDYEYDYLKVCINDNSDCCEDIEWEAPDCTAAGECHIYDLSIDVGDCIQGTNLYVLTIDFEYENADNAYFDLYVRNGEHIGYFALAELPLTIEGFELSGYEYDYLKVCINDQPDCCSEIEWEAPDCNSFECDIYDLVVDVGACNDGTDTYSITFDFEYEHPGNDYFDVYVRDNVFIGFYSLSELPVTIEEFELSGHDNDYLRVCINDNPSCCSDIEWDAPNCD